MTPRARSGTRTAFSGALRNRGRGPGMRTVAGARTALPKGEQRARSNARTPPWPLAPGPRPLFLATIRLPMPSPAEKQDTRLMRDMFHTVAPSYDFITRAFSYGMDRGWKRTLVERAQLAAAAVGARPGLGHRRLFAAGGSALPGRRAVAVDLTRAHAAAGAAAGRAAGGLRGCRPAAVSGRGIRLRLHRLRPAQFSRPGAGAGGNRARHAAGRRAGQPGFFSAREPADAAALPGVSLRAGGVLGICAARPPARLHLHSRFAARFRLD